MAGEVEVCESEIANLKEEPEIRVRQTKSMIMETSGSLSPINFGSMLSRSHASVAFRSNDSQPKVGFTLVRKENVKPLVDKESSMTDESLARVRKLQSDLDMMKERFSKLLLGEDMSGAGKGVSSAMALSNAITNLAASVFGEQKKLEPMADETKRRWIKEMDWLLSVTDSIVEFVACKQTSKDGSNMEIMKTRQRTDLLLNIPALRKLDTMLLDCLDNFKDQNEFYYPSKRDEESKNETTTRQENKWWIPTPKVPPNGLSDGTRKWLQHQKDSVKQVLKAAKAINAQILAEMEIPESYSESLPKNGRDTLGDAMYKQITEDFFDPDFFLSSLDLSSEHKILDLENKLEALIEVWKRKLNAKDIRLGWPGISPEKREIFEVRAETVLMMLKLRFPGLPQSDLDIMKIQYNKDVGYAVLESYSRIIESLAFTVLSRIEDVINADEVAKGPKTEEKLFKYSMIRRTTSPDGDDNHDIMTSDNADGREAKVESQGDDSDDHAKKQLGKPGVTTNRMSYIQRLESLGGLKSPRAWHWS